MGTWLGERLFAANSGELAQIRSNLRELRPHSPTFFSRELRECSVNLPEFTRIRTEFAVNWQTVRQKMSSCPATFKYSTNNRSPRTIVQSKSSPRTVFWVNGCSPTGELVRGELLTNAFANVHRKHCLPPEDKSSPLADIVRGEHRQTMFDAINIHQLRTLV